VLDNNKRIFMKKTFLITLMTLFLNVAMAEDINMARAAELACHRIERLVTLRKIDESYLNNFSHLKIELLTQENPESPRFKVTGEQYNATAESAKSIILNLNNEGKTLGHILSDGASEVGPVWGTKDPVTLMENSLHFVIENGSSNNEVSHFLVDLSSVSLLQDQTTGQKLVKAKMTNSFDNKILLVWLNIEGEFIRYEITQ